MQAAAIPGSRPSAKTRDTGSYLATASAVVTYPVTGSVLSNQAMSPVLLASCPVWNPYDTFSCMMARWLQQRTDQAVSH